MDEIQTVDIIENPPQVYAYRLICGVLERLNGERLIEYLHRDIESCEWRDHP